MLVDIELCELHREYSEMNKWINIRAQIKSRMEDIKDKKIREKARKAKDLLDEVVDGLRDELDTHDEKFIDDIEKYYKNLYDRS